MSSVPSLSPDHLFCFRASSPMSCSHLTLLGFFLTSEHQQCFCPLTTATRLFRWSLSLILPPRTDPDSIPKFCFPTFPVSCCIGSDPFSVSRSTSSVAPMENQKQRTCFRKGACITLFTFLIRTWLNLLPIQACSDLIAALRSTEDPTTFSFPSSRIRKRLVAFLVELLKSRINPTTNPISPS